MIDEVDKRLDMCLSFSFPIESYVLSTIVKEKPVPINIYSHKSELYITFFLNDVSTEDRIILETLNPVQMGETLVITEKIANPVLGKISENVDLVPTLADGELYINRKMIFYSFRFHSSQLQGAADLLRAVVSVGANLSEIRLTKSNGLVRVLDEIDQRIPLSLVVFSFKKPNNEKYILEWRSSHRQPDSYIKYGLEGDTTVENVRITGTETSPFLAAIDKDHIPLGSYLEYYGSERVQSYVYVPSLLVKPLLVRLFETMEPVQDFKIESIRNYRDVPPKANSQVSIS
jgi:hypothetical protein